MNSKISDKDKKDWEDFLSSNENLPNKDLNSKQKTNKKIYTFDLHGYSLDDANKKTEDLIRDAYNKDISKLIIVTGKGIHSDNEKDPYISKDLGILKNSVPDFVKNEKNISNKIIRIVPASLRDGGDGAFYIFLKKNSL